MMNKSYYRILTDTDNNFPSTDMFLRVNCTGHSFYTNEVWASSIRQDYYLLYLRSGIVTLESPFSGRRMGPGEMIVFEPGKRFQYKKPAGVEMEYYWAHFTGYGTEEMLRRCGIETGRIVTPGNHECICHGFRKLFAPFLSRDTFLDVEAAGRLGTLLVDIGKCIAGVIAEDPKGYSRIGRAISLIHDHMGEELSVERLAAEQHMSVSHFRAVFRQVTGLSPKEYTTLVKLNYSCELMRQTDLSIQDIGAAVGYGDAQYYNRIFKKYFGISPGTYKKNNKNRDAEEADASEESV